jgi:hypothetical protein
MNATITATPEVTTLVNVLNTTAATPRRRTNGRTRRVWSMDAR